MFKSDYTINTDSDNYTIVIIHYTNRESSVKFEGKHHKEDAMQFIAQFLMVQMGQIGY